MSSTNARMFDDACDIYAYSKDITGKSARITYGAAQNTRCRALISGYGTGAPTEKTQSSTRVSARFTLPAGTVVKAQDLIKHNGVKWKVIVVNSPRGPGQTVHHIVARCETFVSSANAAV